MALELTQEQKDAGWLSGTLEEFLTLIIDHRGKTPKKLGGDWSESGHRVISAINMKNSRVDGNGHHYVDDEIFAKWMKIPVAVGDVFLTSEAPMGAVAYISDHEATDWVVGQRIFALRADEKQLHGRYLYYLLQTNNMKEQLESRSSGTTVMGIKQAELRKVELILQPVEEQKRIAEILGSLDDKIEANSRLIQSLTELVDAQIIKANEYAAETIKVSDLAVHSKEQTLPSRATDGTVLHYSLPAFDAGAVPAKEEAELILSNKFVLSKPVVLFSKLNPGTPRIWMVEPDAERFNFASTEFVVLEPKEGVGLGALWAACRDPRVSQKLSEFARGTSSSHQRVSPKDILESSVVVADIPEEETTLIRKLTAENVSLAQTRDLLIRHLIK